MFRLGAALVVDVHEGPLHLGQRLQLLLQDQRGVVRRAHRPRWRQDDLDLDYQALAPVKGPDDIDLGGWWRSGRAGACSERQPGAPSAGLASPEFTKAVVLLRGKNGSAPTVATVLVEFLLEATPESPGDNVEIPDFCKLWYRKLCTTATLRG